MSRTIPYQGYTINSFPTEDTGTGQWRLSISIAWEKDGTTISRTYWMPVKYPTEMEADLHGITFGQRIIDGEVAGLSVDKGSDVQ